MKGGGEGGRKSGEEEEGVRRGGVGGRITRPGLSGVDRRRGPAINGQDELTTKSTCCVLTLTRRRIARLVCGG